jgi:hypothetical protein
MLDTNQIDQAGKRRYLEDNCLDAWNLISKLENEWVQHKCEKKECAEGYISVNGLEQAYRLMCAASREKFRASNAKATFVKWFTNSHVFGVSHQNSAENMSIEILIYF